MSDHAISLAINQTVQDVLDRAYQSRDMYRILKEMCDRYAIEIYLDDDGSNSGYNWRAFRRSILANGMDSSPLKTEWEPTYTLAFHKMMERVFQILFDASR